MQHRVKFTELFREKELWILIALGLLFFWRPLLLGETFFFRDLSYDFIPQKQLFADFLKQGELPLWDIYRHGGQPYFADPNNSAFHPSNLLYLLLPFFTAFNLTIISHALLYLIGSYLFCRILGFSRLASLVSAMVYAFCGYSLSLINLFGRFLAMSYLPFLFLFWHLALRERKRRWFAFTVAFSVLQVFCGAPEVNVITMLLLLGWALCVRTKELKTGRTLLLWGLLNVFVLGISAVQLLPALEMVRHSSRGAGMDYQEFSSSSLHPKRLPELIIPNFSGTVALLPYHEHYWGVALTDGDDYPYIINIYFGVLPFILALWGTCRNSDNSVVSRRLRIFLAAVFLASLVLSFGKFLPGFRFLYEHLPLMSLFRYPIKFLIAGLFPLALLAGYGFDRLFSQASSQLLRFCLWCSTLLSGVMALLFFLSDSFAKSLMIMIFKQADNEIMRISLGASFWWLFALAFALSLITHYRRHSPNPWQTVGCALLISLDLLLAGSSVNVYAAKEFFSDEPAAAQTIRQHLDGGRLFRDDNPEHIQLYAPSNEVVWGYRWSLETLDGYLGAFWRIPTLFHDDYVGLGNQYVMNLKSAVKSLSWPQKLPLLSAAGITSILSPDAHLSSLPGLENIAEIENNSNSLFYLYQNTRTVASIEFISGVRYAESDRQALELMLQVDYDPRRDVILHEVKAPRPTPGLEACEAVRLDALYENSSRKEYAVSTDCDGFLLFSEPFYPGWTVKVDTASVPLLRANMAFSAIFLAKGEHRITRRYAPMSLLAGMLCSFVFFIGLTIVLLTQARFFRMS